MKSRQAVDVPGVYVGALLEQADDLVLVAGGARRQEHAVGRELDLTCHLPGLGRLPVRLRLLPALELFGPLEEGRARAGLQRHCSRRPRLRTAPRPYVADYPTVVTLCRRL